MSGRAPSGGGLKIQDARGDLSERAPAAIATHDSRATGESRTRTSIQTRACGSRMRPALRGSIRQDTPLALTACRVRGNTPRPGNS